MNQKRRQYTALKHRYIRRMMYGTGILFLFCLASISNVPAAFADGPGGNVTDPVVRAVDIAQPAVVRIITNIDGTLIVHFTSGDVTFPRNGGPGYPLGLSGSGAFISARGDILTADHVVNPPRSDLDSYLQQTAAPDVANYMNTVQRANPAVDSGQVAQALSSGQLRSDSQYDTPRSRVYLSTAYTGPLSAPDFRSLPSNIYSDVDKIEKESTVDQKDVAIIHVSSLNDMPMVQLDDSSGVQTQDTLTILGFPGNGDVSTAPTNLLTLSVNQVFVSSIKTTDTGAPVIQVGGNVEHGDSGGPAIDQQGHVVGIVSFSLATGQSGSTSFLQASNSARALVQSLGLDTTPGPFQKAWNQAFNDYGSTAPGHWHKAAQEFQQLAAKYPLFKAITPFQTYAQQQARTETLPNATPTATSTSQTDVSGAFNSTALLVGGIAVAALVILLTGVIVLRRRRSEAPLLASSASANGQARPLSPSTAGPQTPPPVGPVVSSMQGMNAFGAPPSQPPARPVSASSSVGQSSANPQVAASAKSGALVPWPCGHMNRSVARFCSVCGEPAPKQSVRRFEQ